ncbi:hypothetical protein ScPMuIL_017729 [Solemya velum]
MPGTYRSLPWVYDYTSERLSGIEAMFTSLTIYKRASLNVCYWVVLSKFLGWGMVVVSSLVKLPQISKIRGAKSGKGINVISTLFELTAISGNFGYGYANQFPFSSYGESPFVAFQDCVIVFHILLYGRGKRDAVKFLSIYLVVMGYILSPFVSLSLLFVLQNINTIIVISGKFLQAVTNYGNKGTGQLSGFTLSLVLIGSCIRIFTSKQETGDLSILITYMSSFVMNAVIVVQFLYYWKTGSKAENKKDVNEKID